MSFYYFDIAPHETPTNPHQIIVTSSAVACIIIVHRSFAFFSYLYFLGLLNSSIFFTGRFFCGSKNTLFCKIVRQNPPLFPNILRHPCPLVFSSRISPFFESQRRLRVDRTQGVEMFFLSFFLSHKPDERNTVVLSHELNWRQTAAEHGLSSGRGHPTPGGGGDGV